MLREFIMKRLFTIAAAGFAFSLAGASAQEVSVDYGAHIAVIGGCHDCHTAGYNESGGQVDPNVALAWIEGMPMYAQVGWGLGVWFALLGSVLLLARSRWAVWSFGISLIGAVLSIGYQLALAPPMPGASGGAMMKAIPAVIIVVAVLLFYYARAMEKRGALR